MEVKMATTEYFDPLFPDDLTGEITAVNIYDHDETELNRVIEIGALWDVEVKWQLTGHDAGAIGGKWHVQVSLESMGPGPEDVVAETDKPMDEVEAASDAHNRYWVQRFDGLSSPVNDAGEPVPGVYKLVTLITYFDVDNHPSDMAGFMEGPLITFYLSET
jgi:hypothetical protein